MSTKKRNPIKFEQGSGNVYADLGMKNADRLLARSQIGFHVFQILESRKLKQHEIAEILGIAQPDISHLMNGHFRRFTTDKLLANGFLEPGRTAGTSNTDPRLSDALHRDDTLGQAE